LIGYSYTNNAKSSFFVRSPDEGLDRIIGSIWNKLSVADSNRYIGGGYYSTSGRAAFMCSLIQMAGLDYELRKSSNGINKLVLEPENIYNITCKICDCLK
jgi:hypothetical protein